MHELGAVERPVRDEAGGLRPREAKILQPDFVGPTIGAQLAECEWRITAGEDQEPDTGWRVLEETGDEFVDRR